MEIITCQEPLRPALPCVYGPVEYREQRALFERIDKILGNSELEREFVALAMRDRGLDPARLSGKRLARFTRLSHLAFRSNLARHILGLDHRDFCARLADSPLLQWFLKIGEIDGVKVFAKSTSDRFAHWIGESSLRVINDKFTALLASGGEAEPYVRFGLAEPVCFEELFCDSTCLKADIHFPVDWVLLRDATRTLMKATVLIRDAGLRKRMPQDPLEFLSDMNTLCMKMSAKRRAVDGKKHRKKVLREMKVLAKRVGRHARSHLEVLNARWHESELTAGQAGAISGRIQGVLDKLPAAIKQVHERIIGGRQVPNDKKILSLYDEEVQVMVRRKSGAEVEFGNKLWLAETREGLIADYQLCRGNPSDSKLVDPAIRRLVGEQNLPVESLWGDRGLFSEANEKMLESRNIHSGLCPRDIHVLTDRLQNEEGMREGLKRRAGTEARISIITNVFMGRPARAKGFEHREMMVGWAVLSHNLWVVARMAEAEQQRRSQSGEETCREPGRPKSHAA